MVTNIPLHLRKNFDRVVQEYSCVVQELHAAVGEELACAYLASVSANPYHNSIHRDGTSKVARNSNVQPGSDIQWTDRLNTDRCSEVANDATSLSNESTFNSLAGLTTGPIESQASKSDTNNIADTFYPDHDGSSSPTESRISVLNLDTAVKAKTVSPVTLCRECAHRKLKRKRNQSDTHIGIKKSHSKLDVGGIARISLRKDLVPFIRNYWDTLYCNGLYVHIDSWALEPDSPIYKRRLRHHLIPRELKVNDDLRSLRLSVALLRNLDEYLMFHDEAERRRSRGLQTRQSNQADKNIAYNDYLAHIYTDRAPKDLGQARKALTEDLRYARRWLILINGVEASGEKSAVPGLGAGLLLVCADVLVKKMYAEDPIALVDSVSLHFASLNANICF
jgi:hypothetical protein